MNWSKTMEVKFYPSFSETKLKNYISKQIYRSWTQLHHYGDRICTSALVSNSVPLIIILATIIPPPLIKVLHIYHGEPSTSALITDTCNGTIYPATMWNYTKNSLFWLCFHNVKCELNYTVRKKKYTVLPDFVQAKRINVKKKSFCSFFQLFLSNCHFAEKQGQNNYYYGYQVLFQFHCTPQRSKSVAWNTRALSCKFVPL